MSDRWLIDVLTEAKQRGWCVNAYCTTCGMGDFLQALVEGAKQSGRKTASHPFAAGLRGLTREEVREHWEAVRTILVAPFAAGLRALTREEVREHREAVRTVLVMCSHSVLEELEGRPAGEVLDDMRAEGRASRRRQELAAQAAREAPLRKAARLRERADRHQARLAEKAKRDLTLRAKLEEFAACTNEERVRMLASEPSKFPFGLVPDELIPRAGFDLLSDDEIERIIRRAARLRGWKQLLKALRSRAHPARNAKNAGC